MAESRDNLSVISRLGLALNQCNFPSFCLKPLQVKCFEYVLNGDNNGVTGLHNSYPRVIAALKVLLELVPLSICPFCMVRKEDVCIFR